MAREKGHRKIAVPVEMSSAAWTEDPRESIESLFCWIPQLRESKGVTLDEVQSMVEATIIS
jgi:hypothetical protein